VKEQAMSIFGRISDIIAANVNALLDKAEDPEKMIAQIIREMRTALERARQQGAGAIATERQLARELNEHRNQIAFWQDRARRALAEQREELARQALQRRIEEEDLVRGLERQHARATETSAAVRTTIGALNARLAEAQRKERLLVARNRAVCARREAQRFLAVEPQAFHSSTDRLQVWESRIETLEDELAAEAELAQCGSAQVTAAEPDRAALVEEQLQALKKEIE
jgi:phage shock protein A